MRRRLVRPGIRVIEEARLVRARLRPSDALAHVGGGGQLDDVPAVGELLFFVAEEAKPLPFLELLDTVGFCEDA